MKRTHAYTSTCTPAHTLTKGAQECVHEKESGMTHAAHVNLAGNYMAPIIQVQCLHDIACARLHILIPSSHNFSHIPDLACALVRLQSKTLVQQL